MYYVNQLHAVIATKAAWRWSRRGVYTDIEFVQRPCKGPNIHIDTRGFLNTPATDPLDLGRTGGQRQRLARRPDGHVRFERQAGILPIRAMRSCVDGRIVNDGGACCGCR